MSRQIKFRGKHLKNGEWIYGDLLQVAASCYITNHSETKVNDDHKIDYYSYEVDTDTIGQFTGLYDSKGAEIYEGDILMGGAAGYLEVFWSDDKAAFLAEDYNDFKQTSGNLDYLSVYDVTDFTLCGNVHDNPDFLNAD